MRPGLDGAPVLAAGQGHGVDTVHDALVVGRSPVGVQGSEQMGLDDAAHDLLTGIVAKAQQMGRDGAHGPRQAPVGQVGEDTKVYPPAADLFDQGRQRLDSRVERVGPHGIAGIVQQVEDEHRPQGRLGQDPHLHVAGPAVEREDHGIGLVGQVEEAILLLQETKPRCPGLGHIQDLYLADHDRIGGV